MEPSSHSFPIDMRAPYCCRLKMYDVWVAWVKRGFRLMSALWVAFMMLLSGSMTWRALLIFCLLLHVVFTLM